MTDSYNQSSINLGETPGLTRASISAPGQAETGLVITSLLNFTGTPSSSGNIVITQSVDNGTSILLNQSGTYVLNINLDDSADTDRLTVSLIDSITAPTLSRRLLQSTVTATNSFSTSVTFTLDNSDIERILVFGWDQDNFTGNSNYISIIKI